ncbi:MAG TPA: zinc ribbon domain-containing protein [Kiritimatiellia bacterium]|nr:zinc ribbon domain-containing protein [Kiritimatiellia bacterium]
MPTYEYECSKCGLEFEQFQSISAPPLKRCPKCKGSVRRKIGTGAGLLFKGSGFYITDYRSEGYQKAAKAESSTAAAPAAPAKESAPAAKPAAKEKPKGGKKTA